MKAKRAQPGFSLAGTKAAFVLGVILWSAVCATASDAEARKRFLEVERFARLPLAQQEKALPDFYRDTAPYFLNSILTGILSSYPDNILDRRTYAHPGGDANERWAGQLAAAAADLTPEQVADKLESRLWLDVAARARTRQVLMDNPGPLARLIDEDLAAKDLKGIQRACTAISDLHLRQFTDKVLALYLADNTFSKPAYTALVWLADPATVRPLLDEVQKNPKSLAAHAGLFQGPLAGKPAEPALVKFLDSPDEDLRYHAAYALYECRDDSLAPAIAKLARASELRLQSAALYLAIRLSDEAFRKIRSDLVPLLSAKDEKLRLEALTTFTRHKDLAAGPFILDWLKRDQMHPGHAVTVIQALGALADTSFNYSLHQWGPDHNRQAIARFEAWLEQQATPR